MTPNLKVWCNLQIILTPSIWCNLQIILTPLIWCNNQAIQTPTIWCNCQLIQTPTTWCNLQVIQTSSKIWVQQWSLPLDRFLQWKATTSNFKILKMTSNQDHTSLFSSSILMKRELYIFWDLSEKKDYIKIHILSGKFKHLAHLSDQENLKM